MMLKLSARPVIIHNAIIQDLEQADASCSRIYENVIHQHIISHMQHLHVNLFTVKTLMSLYNEHAKEITAKTA